MTQSELLIKLDNVKSELKQQFGIEEIALFGSYARGEAKEDSDIDIAIIKIDKKDFLKRLQAKEFLETKLHKKIDIGYFDSMRTFIKNRIKQDLIYV